MILATGSKYKELGLVNEKRLAGHGVSWCATCDGFFFRDQDIAVVGGGDSALEEATFLARFAKTVTVIHRRDSLRASKIMQQRAFDNPKITFLWDSEPIDVLGDEQVTGLVVRNRKTGEESKLEVTGLFVAIGHEPRSELLVGPGRPGRRAATSWSATRPPRPTSTACSPAATSSTTSTARPSPPPARAAPPPWTRSVSSPPRRAGPARPPAWPTDFPANTPCTGHPERQSRITQQ